MKRFVVCIILIFVISFGVSLFVKAEDTSYTITNPVEEGKITTNIRIDHAITKLNFFKKNINVIVEYQEKTN